MYELFTFALAAGYAFGGVQSVLTGAYLGFKTIRTGGFTRQMAMLAAVIASLIYIALIYLPTGLLGDNSKHHKQRGVDHAVPFAHCDRLRPALPQRVPQDWSHLRYFLRD